MGIRRLLFVFILLYLSCLISANHRDLVPMEAPANLTIKKITDRHVWLQWDPVDPNSVRGNFRGYQVRIWNHAESRVYAYSSDKTEGQVEFLPFSKNFVTVAVCNDRFVGPIGEAVSFQAPQITPTAPDQVDIHQISDKSIIIQWAPPISPNGVLLGYQISCSIISNSANNITEISRKQYDAHKFQAKLTGLESGYRYIIGVAAINCVGESEKKTGEIVLEPYIPTAPSTPKFMYKINYTSTDATLECVKNTEIFDISRSNNKAKDYDYYDYINSNDSKNNTIKRDRKKKEEGKTIEDKTDHLGDINKCFVATMILWLPDVKNFPGEHFYIQYRLKGEEEFKKTEPELNEDFIVLNEFNACKNYELILTAVAGQFSTDSAVIVTPIRAYI